MVLYFSPCCYQHLMRSNWGKAGFLLAHSPSRRTRCGNIKRCLTCQLRTGRKQRRMLPFCSLFPFPHFKLSVEWPLMVAFTPQFNLSGNVITNTQHWHVFYMILNPSKLTLQIMSQDTWRVSVGSGSCWNWTTEAIRARSKPVCSWNGEESQAGTKGYKGMQRDV